MSISEVGQQIMQNFLCLSWPRKEGGEPGRGGMSCTIQPCLVQAWALDVLPGAGLKPGSSNLSTARVTVSNKEDPHPCKLLQCSVSLPAGESHDILGFI